MKCVHVPDANVKAMREAALSLAEAVQPGMPVTVAKAITHLRRRADEAVDPRCPDCHGHHRLRQGHLDTMAELAKTVEDWAMKDHPARMNLRTSAQIIGSHASYGWPQAWDL